MKFSLSFFNDLVETNLSAAEVGGILTMLGLEMEETFVSEDEDCLDMNIMANRGDAASVLGMAREFAAKRVDDKRTDLYKRLLDGCPREESGSDISSLAKVSIQTEDCSRFAARVFLNTKNGPSPAWLQKRLAQCGQRSVSLIVDLTNYVMLETGQPLHAYDLDTLAGSEIVVRKARHEETLTTLDGVERTLQSHHMVIADGDKPVGVAGVMGGKDTEVSETTTRILLESAHFDNRSVRKTRKDLGLQTEASFRFERSVDPEGVVRALNRFADLYEAETGIRPESGVIDLKPRQITSPPVSVTAAKVSKLLGIVLSPEVCTDYLTRLGFAVTQEGDKLTAQPPSWRFDIALPEDLVEEIGRLHGYEHFGELPPQGTTPEGGVHGLEEATDLLTEGALRGGLNQACSHSLGDLHPLDRPGDKVRVRTPHSPEMAYLRSSILPGLALTAVRNGGINQHWFESGSVFSESSERKCFGILCSGSPDPVHPQVSPSQATFFSVKGLVSSLLSSLNISPVFESSSEDQRFHPTRQARVGDIAVLGQIHPDVADAAGLPKETYLAEIWLDSAYKASGRTSFSSKPISRNPASNRDIAVLAPKTLAYSDIQAAIVRAGEPYLEDFNLFDIYDGKGVPEGHHSLAISLQFRKMGANFTDEEANQARDQILAELASLGATLRQ